MITALFFMLVSDIVNCDSADSDSDSDSDSGLLPRTNWIRIAEQKPCSGNGMHACMYIYFTQQISEKHAKTPEDSSSTPVTVPGNTTLNNYYC